MSEISIRKIIKDAGGPDAIARASVTAGAEISRDAVYKWTRTGIPDRHWPTIIALTAYGPTELYLANCAVREVSTEFQLTHEAAQ
ncbi:carph-isopro domain-containing protein [Pararhizobium sp. DWP3-4]|uniref:carph-isopro domain-containing protein n=1 Tax=Pararhizobium sp. DWP3-4 TaxID=2804565 RepID=UPI003CEFE8B8